MHHKKSNVNFTADGLPDVPVDPSSMCVAELKGWLNARQINFGAAAAAK